MPGPDRPSFGRRNAPPKQPTGHEALRPPRLSAQMVIDTIDNNHGGEFHSKLRQAIDDTTSPIRADAAAVAALVNQGREVPPHMLQKLTEDLAQWTPARPKTQR